MRSTTRSRTVCMVVDHAAIRAGKHVLCEKPFAANGQEARAVADMASGSGKVVFEAFHYR